MNKSRLLIALSILLLAAPLAAQEPGGTLAQIKKSGRIRIGYRDSEPPMSYVDKGGPAGYSIDICNCIADEVGKKIGSPVKKEYVPVTAENRFKALADNKIDILCGSTTKTLSRGELVDFTQLIFVTGSALMTVGENSSGFSGKKIGVVKGTTTVDALQGLLKETGTKAEVVLFDTSKEAVAALREKKIDAFSADQVVLIGIALQEGGPKTFVIDPSVFSFEPFALAVRRNDADFRLVADREISALCRSKKLLGIYDKWIGQYLGQLPPLFEAMIQLGAIPE